MAAEGSTRAALLAALRGSQDEFEKILACAVGAGEGPGLAESAADLILEINAGGLEPEQELVERLLRLASVARGERLRTVALGSIWREDLDWLSMRLTDGEAVRERLLRIVAEDKPKALPPAFWRAVAERGARFAAIAFGAAEKTHPQEAARLLVGLCRAALKGEIDLEIRAEVDRFLGGRDSSVRTAFLAAVKKTPEAERRKLITHFDMSLMAELDRSAIEHRAEGFFYDADAEKRKRDTKSKDIFGEVKRRLDRGDKAGN